MLNYPPLSRGPLVQLPAARNFCKARLSGCDKNFVFGHLLRSTERSGSSNGSRHSDPFEIPLFQFPTSKAFLQSLDRYLQL